MDAKLIEVLKEGGVTVIPTDTIYGLVGSAFNELAVAKIYALKKRDLNKPLIILISDLADLKLFGVALTLVLEKKLNKYWPGPVSLILPTANGNLAFRLPAKPELQELIKHTGPLVAPSANLEGEPPAETIEQAQNYFGDQVDFYLDGGQLQGKASTLIDLTGEEEKILRP